MYNEQCISIYFPYIFEFHENGGYNFEAWKIGEAIVYFLLVKISICHDMMYLVYASDVNITV